MPEPRQSDHTVNGVRLTVFEWPGRPPPVLLVHATSFHARCWDRVVERLHGRHVIAPDLRGHGRSERPAPPYGWRLFGDDLAELARALELRGAIGVGHSMGGHALTIAAALAPDRFDALLLVDPVISSPEAYRAMRRAPARDSGLSSETARRRSHWSSPQEMFDRLRTRHPFTTWRDDSLHDYCQYGLLPAADGDGYELACTPEIEAAVYRDAPGIDVYELIPDVRIPVRVLRARAAAGRSGLGFSPAAPELASHFASAEDVSLPDHSHYIPMDDPALVAMHIETLIARLEAAT